MISCLSVGCAGSADGANASAGAGASFGVKKCSGSSQMNAPIARTAARTMPATGRAEVDDGSSEKVSCTRRSFKVKGWGAPPGLEMAAFEVMVAPLVADVRARLPSPHSLTEQTGKQRRALPDDDALTVAEGIRSVGTAVHTSSWGAMIRAR